MSNPFSTSPIESGGGGGGGGDVVGPGSSTAGNIAEFDDTTGALLADSGIASNTVVVGPASATDNAIARYNTTTGKLLQDSGVTVGDVAAGSVAVATTAGNSLTIAATAPAAANGATVAGKTVGVTASAAVASLDTAGAAAGGAVTIASGAAARNTSGNADGGAINLTPGAGIGTGLPGGVNVGTDTGSLRLQVASNLTQILAQGSTNLSGYASGSVLVGTGAYTNSTNPTSYYGSDYLGLYHASLPNIRFTRTTNANNSHDAGVNSPAAGVVRISNGGSGYGHLQHAGQAFLAADATSDNVTMANLGLSVPLTTGRKYEFELTLYAANSTAADGIKIDWDGGSLTTVTNFIAHGVIHDSAVLAASVRTAALATDISAAVITGNSIVVIKGSIEPSSSGTFIPRFAMLADTGGTLTIARGSTLRVFDNP